MNLVFFDDPEIVTNLRPFTFTRPVSDIRLGILTLRSKWHKYLGIQKSSNYTELHLSAKYPLHIEGTNLCINSSVLPEPHIVEAIQGLTTNQMLFKEGNWLAGIFTEQLQAEFDACNMNPFEIIEYTGNVSYLKNTWDIFSLCGAEIKKDFELLAPYPSTPLMFYSTHGSLHVTGDKNLLHIEDGAVVRGGCIFNTEAGPIYLDKDSEVMEGCMVRGPFYLGEHAQLKMGAKIYGPTSLGPYCKVGGEVNNSVFFGYSSKAHDGFLGNSVIGEWCNLGADTNNSNLKNTYAEVKLWHYGKKSFVKTGLQFCGLVMGDHSKCGINTMFNTGTVVGVSANIFGDGFPRNYIPSFSWGGAAGFTPYKLQDAITTAKLVYERRNLVFDSVEEDIFKHLFSLEYPA
jgi:UDP-N-acetylglucosamine diphosphorylase/glucosamine-1-phosphate N-acetyltransferase